jgi:hypothetical protein
MDDLRAPVAKQRDVRRDDLIGEEAGAAIAPEVDRVQEVEGLQGGISPDLAGLLLHAVVELVLMVEYPVAEALEPSASAGEPDRLPIRLCGPNPGDDLGHPLRRVDRDAPDDRAVRRAMHLEGLAVGGRPVDVGGGVRRGFACGNALHPQGTLPEPRGLVAQREMSL